MQWITAVTALTTLYIVVYSVQSSFLRLVSLEPHSDPPRMGELLSVSILYLERITDWELELKPRPYSRMYVLSTMPGSPSGHGYS